MKRDWDDRAREDAKWFINTLRLQQSEEEFDQSGRVEVEGLVLAELPLLTWGRAPQSLRVLEIGCGNGINLMLLACRFPDIAFTGVELTAEGQAAAQSFQQAHAQLPEHLVAFAPQPLPDPAGFRRVRFIQGSATDLPFESGAFDLAITVLALEQMEQIRARALGEIARVVRSHALMIEPFADVNGSFWQRLNVDRRNYFRGRIDDLPGFGLNPIVACADFPQKYILRAALVLSERVGQPIG